MKKLVNLIRTLVPSDSTPQAATAPETKSTTAAAENTISFADLGLMEPLLRAVLSQGYDKPTPIQAQAIPEVLRGRDLLGCAQTGTGKTAAFSLPLLQRLAMAPRSTPAIRALILSPTRELALQIDESLRDYGKHLKLTRALVYGGVGLDPQRRALTSRPDIIVATPGRLLDLMRQGYADLKSVSVLVLDEADRMLDMGFINDVRKIVAALPATRQNLLFSATMPPEIRDLAMNLLHDPVKVAVAPVASTSELIAQAIYFVPKPEKRHLLLHLLDDAAVSRALVFTRTKAVANKVSLFLCDSGVNAEAIHGNKSQNARQRALENFRAGKTRVLVASDLAARGIDIDEVSHVINFDLPNVPETYVHRIGRTGRAEQRGIAWSFCDHEERSFLRAIENLIRQRVPVVTDHPYAPKSGSEARSQPTQQPTQQGGGRPRQDARRPNRPQADRSPSRYPRESAAPRSDRGHEGARDQGAARDSDRGQGQGRNAGRTQRPTRATEGGRSSRFGVAPRPARFDDRGPRPARSFDRDPV